MDPVDVDMISSDSSYTSDVSDDGSATEWIDKPKYRCKYCPKMYSKIQALGGHQNAHKREREIIERQNRAITRINQHDPDPYPNPSPYPVPSQYALPPGFEQPRFAVDRPDNLAVVYNHCIGSSKYDFARLGIDSSRGWAINGNSYQSVVAQTQLQPLLSTSSPICLDLCLGVGNNSQPQVQSKEPFDTTEKITDEKENDDHSLSLSLKL